MLFALFVIEKDPLLQGILHDLPGNDAAGHQLGRCFQGVIGIARISIGIAGDHLEGIILRGDVELTQTALLIGESPFEQLCQLLIAQRLQPVDAATGKQGGNHLK